MKASAEPTLYALFVVVLLGMIIILGTSRIETALHSPRQEQHYLANKYAALISTLSVLPPDIQAYITDRSIQPLDPTKKTVIDITPAYITVTGIAGSTTMPIIRPPIVSIIATTVSTTATQYTRTPTQVRAQSKSTPNTALLNCPKIMHSIETIGIDPSSYNSQLEQPNKKEKNQALTQSQTTRAITAALITKASTTLGWKATRELSQYIPGTVYSATDPELSQTTQERINALAGQDALISIQTGTRQNTLIAYIPKNSDQSQQLACALLNTITQELNTQSELITATAIIPLDLELLTPENQEQKNMQTNQHMLFAKNSARMLLEIGKLGDTLTTQPELTGAAIGTALIEAAHAT